jgi:hypothetical protein
MIFGLDSLVGAKKKMLTPILGLKGEYSGD